MNIKKISFVLNYAKRIAMAIAIIALTILLLLSCGSSLEDKPTTLKYQCGRAAVFDVPDSCSAVLIRF